MYCNDWIFFTCTQIQTLPAPDVANMLHFFFFPVVSVTDKEAKQNHSVLRHSKAALLAVNWEILSVPCWTNNLN